MSSEKPRRPTIDDVAARAGVSSAAVSFAVNNRPGVGEETRRRILEAAEELGWRPSASARALTEARARAVGLLLARSLDQLEVDPFFVRFLAGIERTLAHNDYDLVLRVAEQIDTGAYGALAAAGRVEPLAVDGEPDAVDELQRLRPDAAHLTADVPALRVEAAVLEAHHVRAVAGGDVAAGFQLILGG